QSHTPRNCFTNNEDYGNHIAELTKFVLFRRFRLDWRTRSSSFACSCKLRLKREVLTETLTFTLSKQFCRFLNEDHYSFSRGNIVTITHNSIIQPVETELYKIALTSISFNQTDYVTYVPTQFESDRLVRHRKQQQQQLLLSKESWLIIRSRALAIAKLLANGYVVGHRAPPIGDSRLTIVEAENMRLVIDVRNVNTEICELSLEIPSSISLKVVENVKKLGEHGDM
ncbi:hypothetical protein P5673_033192, partial [Acropora cervicornis]